MWPGALGHTPDRLHSFFQNGPIDLRPKIMCLFLSMGLLFYACHTKLKKLMKLEI